MGTSGMGNSGHRRLDLGSNTKGISFVRLIDPIKFMVEYAVVDRMATELRAVVGIKRQDAEKIAIKVKSVSAYMIFTDEDLLRLVEYRIHEGQSVGEVLDWLEKVEALFEA